MLAEPRLGPSPSGYPPSYPIRPPGRNRRRLTPAARPPYDDAGAAIGRVRPRRGRRRCDGPDRRRPRLAPIAGRLLRSIGLSPVGSRPAAAADAAEAPLRVAAASDLQAALPRSWPRVPARSAGSRSTPTFGASGQLAEQIRQGAPFDVFLAAEPRRSSSDLADEGLVRPESVRPYAPGSLVLAVTARVGRPRSRSLADLGRARGQEDRHRQPRDRPLRDGGEAGAGAGRALGRRSSRRSSRPSRSARRSSSSQTGNAEAGLVGRAIADVPGGPVVALDPTLYDPIVQGLGVVARVEPAGGRRGVRRVRASGRRGRGSWRRLRVRRPPARGRRRRAAMTMAGDLAPFWLSLRVAVAGDGR